MYRGVQRHSQRGHDNEPPDYAQQIGQSKQTSHKTAEEFAQVVLDGVDDGWYVRYAAGGCSDANFEIVTVEQVW
jgi:hypothetical protein